MRLRQIPFIIFTYILFTISTSINARHFSDDLKSCLNRITAHIYNDQFDEAKIIIDSLDISEYQGPMVPLFYAILFQARMMAAESNYLEKDFFESLDSLDDHCRKMLEIGSDSALAYFCLGHSHAFRSLHNSRAGKTWAAIKGGLKARNDYERAYKADHSFHDIALGLGSYRYWKTVKTGLLNWTPLFKREKENGIRLLRLAADSSDISSDAASTSLIWIYINEGLYGEALRIADLMRRKYPHGLTFCWALGEASFKVGDYRLAARTYSEILDRLHDNPGNYYNVIEATYYINECYRIQDQRGRHYSDSLLSLQSFVQNLSIPEETLSRQKKKLKEILRPVN